MKKRTKAAAVQKHYPPTPGGWTAEGLDVEYQIHMAALAEGPFKGLPCIHIFKEHDPARTFFADHITKRALAGDTIDAKFFAVIRHARGSLTGSKAP